MSRPRALPPRSRDGKKSGAHIPALVRADNIDNDVAVQRGKHAAQRLHDIPLLAHAHAPHLLDLRAGLARRRRRRRRATRRVCAPPRRRRREQPTRGLLAVGRRVVAEHAAERRQRALHSLEQAGHGGRVVGVVGDGAAAGAARRGRRPVRVAAAAGREVGARERRLLRVGVRGARGQRRGGGAGGGWAGAGGGLAGQVLLGDGAHGGLHGGFEGRVRDGQARAVEALDELDRAQQAADVVAGLAAQLVLVAEPQDVLHVADQVVWVRVQYHVDE